MDQQWSVVRDCCYQWPLSDWAPVLHPVSWERVALQPGTGPLPAGLCACVICHVQRFCRLGLCFHRLEGRFLAYPVFREVRTELLKKPQTRQDHFEAEASQTAALLRRHHPLSVASSPLPPIGMGLGEPTPEQLSYQVITQDSQIAAHLQALQGSSGQGGRALN